MTDPMAEIREGFFAECDELLESLQDALSLLAEEADPSGWSADAEAINIVFRAVHSIKGGAGAFGLNDLVGFAHHYETALDLLRGGKLSLNDALMKLLFQAADLLQDHVRAAREGGPPPPGAEPCLAALDALTEEFAVPGDEEVEANAFQPLTLGLPPLDEVEQSNWMVRFKPAATLYSLGNEPLYLLRALRDLGTLSLTCDITEIPDLAELNAETAALSWSAELPGDRSEEDIREIFDFVDGLCELIVTRAQDASPPGNQPPEGPSLSLADLFSTPDRPPETGPAAPQTRLAQEANDIAVQPAAEPASVDHDPPHKDLPASRRDQSKEAPSEGTTTVRVDLDRIDRLVNLVGELVITQAMLAQSVAESGLQPNSSLMTGLESFTLLTREIQDSVMMIRAQPVKPLFQRMARIVREASAVLGKDVRLRTEGETTEVDKTVIERLADPLTHMIRNAVDHGLEMPEARLAAGKSATGTVTISAQHRSGRLLIELSDDGAGINRARVFETAVERGLISPDAQLSDAEIDNLLFLPGFSTAKEVSALSGRGVGMDVVRSAIHALSGRISIHSENGRGTRFSISLPLTLAVLDGMVVSVAGETLVVPLSSILETASMQPSDVRTIGTGLTVMQLRGAFVPLYDLGAELGYSHPRSPGKSGTVLLTALENGNRAALVVDAIIEQRQVVIKGLQQSYGRIPGIAAATILGDGRIALILDPADLIQTAGLLSPRGMDLALAG